MSADADHDEAEELVELARALARCRADMAAAVDDVQDLVAAALRCETPIEVETGFEQAARRLRASWLRSVAAETARVLRSPTDREVERLARSSHDAYGYERDFQPESLEARCEAFFGHPPAGWTAAHVLFSSGQAALATVLLHLGEQAPGKLRVAHFGSYFETRELVQRACAGVATAEEADCVIGEPIACDGRVLTEDAAAIARSLKGRQTLVVDETLSVPQTGSTAILGAAVGSGAAVVRLVSGLKLLQQGLELANVGIVTVFTPTVARTASLADGLRRIRTLTGAGLRFVDALALEAPFFLEPAMTQAYARRIFAHNAALKRAVMAQNRVFKPLPEAGHGDETAPYCVLELRDDNSVAALETLADRIERECRARGLLFQRGGSFGFRGHRYEVIEPETGDPPFLRVAMGVRHDRSCDGVIAFMGKLSAGRA